MPAMTYTLRALAHLLRYPDAPMRASLDVVLAALADEARLDETRRTELAQLAARIAADGLAAEAEYVDLFDRGRGTALHLFEHVHGDSRDRGPAMLDLVATYEAAGLLLGAGELPDHLTVLLEYASTQPPTQARAFLAEFAHLLAAIAQALDRRRSDYATVLRALLDLVDAPVRAMPALPDEPSLDESWEEPAAFDGCGAGASGDQGASGTQPPLRTVHVVRRPRPSDPSAAAAR
jgi:nitrate reductase delta subunit